MTLDIAGEQLTEYLRQLLANRGYNFTTPYEIDIVREIKHSLCYVAENINEEREVECFYEMPDGNSILVGYERYRCPEVMFEPSYLSYEDDGLHHKLY
eukprot:CAMPEP_0201283114 /NCGR_PEP_ID=MMETSP1317-20130820/7656_1 /ASSEMBLY_ACC=CAM_ASM_000770 /TAXON_ID=187299 /ORGANISM="Undescribed Undescribed, Strain Undescribed" /LENGTH=97 /DNA_ID=CAMNT_0047598233 /DNA_START=349 /DNA_END=642 /DNA_ORIENTATION=-